MINKIDTLEKELNSLQENLRKKNEIIYNLDREKKDLDISYENVQFDLQNFKINENEANNELMILNLKKDKIVEDIVLKKKSEIFYFLH